MKIAFALVFAIAALPAVAQQNPSTMQKIGTVDPRFQSYNIEMVEVTGGRFWKPYGSTTASLPSATHTTDSNQLPGLSPNLFEFRPPIDLSNPRLRMLAAALALAD